MEYPEIEQLLPHGSPMILLGQVLSADNDNISIETEITESLPFFDADGHMPAYVTLEMMAQATAALAGWRFRQLGEPPKIGFLLGTRQLELKVAHLELGQKLTVSVTQVFQDDQMAVVDGMVESQGQLIAKARLNLYQPQDPLTIFERNPQ